MFHIPITKSSEQDSILEFSHHNQDAPAGHWKKDNLISLPHIKINVFLEGHFSFFTNGENYTPTYGDVCVLCPYQIHSAQITKPTHTDYYQLDIGMRVLDNIPGGSLYIEKLIAYSTAEGAFFRPEERHRKEMIGLCRSIEEAIGKQNRTLAYIKSAELIMLLCDIYGQSVNVTTKVLSLAVQNTLHFIETYFDSHVTIEILAKQQDVSSSYLSRIFKKEVGMGIHTYISSYRVMKASYLLKKYSVSEVCYMCGFSDSSHFISVFKKHFGCTPFQYKKSIE